MLGIVIDGLVGDSQLDCGAERFTGTRVAYKGWVCATGHLQAYALPRTKVIGSGPDVDLEVQAAIFLGSNAVWPKADDAVTQVNRFA